ncbi:F0F1 ATP synthase subunit A [Haloimpatiens lingqiaonensis]|uniref:F0F1 ATP synthase subunit A n=1 Tax=Haloimpatiens lingqiaonensis TaxID=1380675 RepID=UPI0010FD631F|nr:F0F1 ATP synthase subunit A [Haloimpatiens lingqiaonensis]
MTLENIITTGLVAQWVIMIILIILSIVLTRSFKEVPEGKQNVAEAFVELIAGLVEDNMGKEYIGFVPFIGTLFLFLLCLNLVGLVGIKPPTSDYSVALGLGLVSFLVVQGYTIKKVGIIHYFLGFAQPYAFLLPLNILERISFPISLSLRLFGNMFAATIIMDLLYEALRHVGAVVQFGIPIPLHAYFDVFDGSLQMVIFIMLTMINIKLIAEHD